MSLYTVSGAEKLRLDKWLWYARFCKTRALAASLCSAGQVSVENRIVKPSYVIKSGSAITISHGGYRRSLIVIALGTRRGPPAEAQALYHETGRQKLKDLEPSWELLLSDETGECDDHAYGIEEAKG